MDFSFSEGQKKFRQEVRRLLEDEIKRGSGSQAVMPGYGNMPPSLLREWHRGVRIIERWWVRAKSK